jgi:dipeptidyl aminopeptidase/acylaminoacyl peptidase
MPWSYGWGTEAMRILAGLASCALCAAAVASGATAAPGTTVEPRVHRFLEVAVSPDGRRVATVEGDSPVGGYYPEVRDLVIRTAADGKAVTVSLPCGRVPQCWPAFPAWTPDGRQLAFTVRTPGTHSYAVYRVDADSIQPTQLLSFAGTLGHLRYAPDGTLAMLAVEHAVKEVGATEAGAPVAGDLGAPPPEQRIALLEAGSLRWVSPADLWVYEFDWRPDGKGFVGTAAPGDGDDNWWVAKLYAFARADGAARVLYAPASIREQLAAPRVSPDGRRVAFVAGIMSDFGNTGGQAYVLRLDTSTVKNLTPDLKASVTNLAWTCQGELGAWLIAGENTQWVTFGKAEEAAGPSVHWSAAESVEAGDHLACPSGALAIAHESFTSPPELLVGRPGAWREITHLNRGLSTPGTARSIEWKNDGFDVQGWLLLPQETRGKIPMVTIVHGGPASAAMPRFSGPGLQWRMLERGWAVFYPNPRGSYGHGEAFTLANVRDFGHGDLRDILAGIDAVERVAPVDDGRLGLMGHSYGGFMVMWAVTQTQRFKATVAGAGISNWLSYYGENGIDQWMLPYFGASAYDDPEAYARSSAINYIRNVRTPTFAYVGESDVECPAPQTQEFWHALNVLGVPTAIMIYPGEGHAFRDPAHSSDLLERTLAWFDGYLR